MDQCRRQNVVAPLLYFIAFNYFILIKQSDGRYLRPSDHGLSYQDGSMPPTKGNAPDMLSFFNGGKTSSLPEAKNVTGSGGSGAGEAWWKNRETRMSHDAHKSHMREILLIVSLVCGLSGVVLLVATAFVFLIRCRYRKQQHRQPRPRLGVEWSKHNELSTRESTSALSSAVVEKKAWI